MKIAAMITLYNPSEDNIKNASEYLTFVDKIYLIDNSDVDNSKMFKKNKNIVYVPNMDNLGIARALNQAAELAIADKFDWLLTMDQDSVITHDVFDKLVEYIKTNDCKKVGIVSPYHDVDTNYPKEPVEVEDRIEVMTSGNLLNLSIYKKIGGFKDWLFIDDVDIEYCFHLKREGYLIKRLNNVIMEHHLGNTVTYKFFKKKFIVSNHNAMRRYYMVRNVLYLNDMYKDLFPDYCRFLTNVQKGQVRYILMFEKNKFKKLKMMYRGYKDYKKHIVGRFQQ